MKFQVKHLLLNKDLWGFMDGMEPIPTDEAVAEVHESGLSEKVTEGVFSDCTGYNTFSALPGDIV